MMRKDMMADMAEMLTACGVKNVHTYDGGYSRRAWAFTKWVRHVWVAIRRLRC